MKEFFKNALANPKLAKLANRFHPKNPWAMLIYGIGIAMSTRFWEALPGGILHVVFLALQFLSFGNTQVSDFSYRIAATHEALSITIFNSTMIFICLILQAVSQTFKMQEITVKYVLLSLEAQLPKISELLRDKENSAVVKPLKRSIGEGVLFRILFTFTVVLFVLSDQAYSIETYFVNECILAHPYMSDHQYQIFQSRFVAVSHKNDYEKIISDIDKILVDQKITPIRNKP